MSIITIPNVYTNGEVIDAGELNTNLSTIVNDYNGNITNDNLSSSIAITDNHLNQITTAGKVSGLALVSLASIPSGAGVIPIANLPSGIFTPIIFSAHTSATQGSINGWTQRTTTWTIDEDSNSYWASNTYTPLTAGWYLISYMDAINFSAGGQTGAIGIYKNGVLYAQNASPAQATQNPCSGVTTAIIQMNGSTDYIQPYLFTSDSGCTGEGTGYGFISIVRVF